MYKSTNWSWVVGSDKIATDRVSFSHYIHSTQQFDCPQNLGWNKRKCKNRYIYSLHHFPPHNDFNCQSLFAGFILSQTPWVFLPLLNRYETVSLHSTQFPVSKLVRFQIFMCVSWESNPSECTWAFLGVWGLKPNHKESWRNGEVDPELTRDSQAYISPPQLHA